MGYKVTISDGTILEKSIEYVTFNADTPSDDSYCMRNYTINSISITGKIGAGEKTISLYEWALLAASNPNCYKEIEVEYIHAGQLLRNVKFSKAFVVDYSESYTKDTGVGHFSILIRQLADVDIECANEVTQQSTATETAPTNVVEEIILPQVLETAVTATSIAKKDRPKATDILAKRKMMQDNGNAGVSKPGILEITSAEQISKELLETKPKMSKDPKKWIDKGGKITIDENGTWTYHDWEGNSVSYPDGYPDFKSAGMVKQEVPIGKFEGWNKDFPKADELAPNGPKSSEST